MTSVVPVEWLIVLPVPVDRPERWRVEHDAQSSISLVRGRVPWGGPGVQADVRLSDGGRHSQYGAIVAGVERGSLTAWTRIRLTAAASAPMRADRNSMTTVTGNSEMPASRGE